MDQPRPLRPAPPPPDSVALLKGCLVALVIMGFILGFWAAFLYITISAFD